MAPDMPASCTHFDEPRAGAAIQPVLAAVGPRARPVAFRTLADTLLRDEPATRGTTPPRFRHDVQFLLAVAVALAPVLASIVRAASDHYLPAADFALIELQVRAVGTHANPLVGAWSRFGWQHPGPILFYLLAIPYRLAGTAPFGLQFGAAVINGAAITGCVALVRRHGPAAMWLMALALAVLQVGFDANLLRDDWNAAVVVVPFALLIVAAAEARDGSRAALAVVPLAATFVAQTHVAYVALSLPAVGFWIEAVWHRWADPAARRRAIWAMVVAAICWIPVAVDALEHSGGNLRKIADWSLQSHSGAAGLSVANKLVGTATSLSGRAVNGLHESIFYTLIPKLTTALPGIALLGLVAVVLWRGASAPFRRTASLLLVTWFVGYVATARISGPLFPHLVWWLVPMAVLTWWCILTSALAVFAAFRRHSAESLQTGNRALAALAGVAAAALAVVLCVRVAGSDTDLATRRPAIVQAASAIDTAARRDHLPVVVDRTGDYLANGAVQAGVLAHLAHRGIDATVPIAEPSGGQGNTAGNLAIFGSHRVSDRHPTFLLAGRVSLLKPPGRLVGQYDPLSPAEARRWRTDYDLVAAALVGAHQGKLTAWLPTAYSFIAQKDAPQAFDATTSAALRDLGSLNGRDDGVFVWELPR